LSEENDDLGVIKKEAEDSYEDHLSNIKNKLDELSEEGEENDLV
jgi:hypothetical protein